MRIIGNITQKMYENNQIITKNLINMYYAKINANFEINHYMLLLLTRTFGKNYFNFRICNNMFTIKSKTFFVLKSIFGEQWMVQTHHILAC